MKKFKLITAVLASTLVLTGCDDKACEHVDSDNNHICDKCGVELPYVEKISIVGVPQGTVGIGDTFKLTANVTAKGNADKTVNWSVDKPAIGTIASDGTFKAVAPGTVSVTATSAFDSKVSAKVDIQVVNKGFDPSMYDDGYDFVEEFPEAVISEGLDTDKLFVPSESFTDGGMYFAAYENGCYEVVYGVSLTLDYLYALADEMDADENLFYMDEDETGMFYGCKDNNYSVMLTFADNGASYFANYYIPNSLIYDDEKLTDNEDWTDEEKLVFTDNEFPILPFVQLGESYSVTFWEAEGKSPACIEIYDSFADYARQDLYMEKLVSEGWEYVPTTGSFQLKINDTEAWIVDVFYYYGTVIQLSRGALTVSEFPSEVVKAYAQGYVGFYGPLVDFEAISIEGYGPAYNMYDERANGAFIVDCMYCDLQSFFDYRAALSKAGYVYLMTESSDEGIYELFEYGNLVLELAFFPSQAGSFDNGILELIFMDNSYTSKFPASGIVEFVGSGMDYAVPAPEGSLFGLIGQPGLAEVQVLGDVSAYLATLMADNWVLDDAYYGYYGYINAYKGNVVIQVTPNSGYFVLDIYIGTGSFEPTSTLWPTKALAAYTNNITSVVIPKITKQGALFAVNATSYANTFILSMYNVTAEEYAEVLKAKGFEVTYNDYYEQYDFSLENVSGYAYDGSFGASVVFQITPYGIWPEHDLEAIIAEINPESNAVIPFIGDCSGYSAGYDSWEGVYYMDFYPMNNTVVPAYAEKLAKLGWIVKDLGSGEYKAHSADETIEIYIYQTYSGYEMTIYEYVPPITSWPIEQVAALVEGAGATGTLTPFIGEVTEFVLSESPRSIKVYAAAGRTATQDMADYIAALFDDGYYYYADGGYYAKPGDTLKVTLTDYYADYGADENLFSIKLAKLSAAAEIPAAATFPMSSVEDRLAGLNLESVPVPSGHEFFYSNGITSHAAEVTVLGGDPISFAADLLLAGFTLDAESSTSSVDSYKSESGTLFVDVPKAGDAYGAFTVTYTSVAVVKSIESITPNEIAKDSEPSADGFMANVTFVGDTTGQVSVDSIVVDTSTLGETTAHVSAGGVDADVTVTIIEAPAPSPEWPLEDLKTYLGEANANALPVITDAESINCTGDASLTSATLTVVGSSMASYKEALIGAGFKFDGMSYSKGTLYVDVSGSETSFTIDIYDLSF